MEYSFKHLGFSLLLAALYLNLGWLPITGQELPGSVSGIVMDGSGAGIAGAKIKLSRDDGAAAQDISSDGEGEFSFARVNPGSYRVAVEASGFAPQTSSCVLHAGESLKLATFILPVATLTTDVEVTLPKAEIAEEEIRGEEQQRLIGVVPNFLVSYVPNAMPLTAKQKFELSWKTSLDPFSFGFSAILAGVQHARNDYAGYGQGMQGYAKRFGAAYGNLFVGTMVSSAIMPSLLKQDPRYFVRGTGTKGSRLLYALANSVIRKGDNGRWQPNYSDIVGGLAAAGISNLYYPAKDRDGAALTLKNALIGIGSSAITNICQEFFFRKLTGKAPHNAPVPAGTSN